MDFLEELNKDNLVFFIKCYNNYITEFFDEHEDGMIPVSIYEFFDNEFSEIVENKIKEIENRLDYCNKRDKVCLAIDGEQERLNLEIEFEKLENLFDLL